jgi:hypothetical protein
MYHTSTRPHTPDDDDDVMLSIVLQTTIVTARPGPLCASCEPGLCCRAAAADSSRRAVRRLQTRCWNASRAFGLAVSPWRPACDQRRLRQPPSPPRQSTVSVPSDVPSSLPAWTASRPSTTLPCCPLPASTWDMLDRTGPLPSLYHFPPPLP